MRPRPPDKGIEANPISSVAATTKNPRFARYPNRVATPLAPDVSGRHQGAPVALVAFLTALATAIGASRAHFVARAPDNTAAVSRTPEPVSDREKSSIDQAAHKWLAGSHTKAVRVTVAGAGLVDIAAVRDDTGEVRGALLVARDVDAAPDAASALVEVELGAALVSSVLDAPPAVAARQALIDWASSQSGRRTAFAVSIDRLGIANEVLGYRAGDAVLSTLVERIERWAGPAGRIARVGGARYIAIRTDLLNEVEAVNSAEQLREFIAGPVELDGLGVSRSASIGVATDHDGATTPAVLLAKAVVSGAAARAAGGDAVHRYYDPAATTRLNQLRLELELHDALVAGQLRVHYQPEHDLRTGHIVGVEALLRWEHPQRGLLGADSFVPYSEQSHTFTAVQHWVVDETCCQLARWMDAGAADDLVLRVNVSAAQILHGAITAVLVSALERNHLRGDQVCVEIT